ncbi:MAG TPA: TonB-dependent receptor plug domain-containing protein, partial [Sediminibacterium sp.]|nr:TonB-dependent receptor plug domain-containing protein [Sediminibacterium sp.]
MNLNCFRLCVVALFTMLSTALLAQTKKVSGTILNEEAKPLAGVSVTIKGTKTGTQTNASGVFTIDVAEGKSLVFTMIGFAPREVLVGSSAIVDLTLATVVSELEDVVVTGYGSQKRKELTGAVVSVNPKTFEHSPTTNVATVLQGNVPGLRIQQRTGQPGTTPSITFRGGTDFGGGGTPLFIVDGVIVPSLYGLDINDVASIDLLKDAASTAIYGARAANGVVLVSTKKGKRGKAQVTYSYNNTTNYIRKNPSEYLNASDYIRMNRLGIQARFRGDSLDNNTGAMNTDRNQLFGAWGWAVNSGWTSNTGLYTTQLLNNANRFLLNDSRWKLLVDRNPFNVSQIDSLVFVDLSA